VVGALKWKRSTVHEFENPEVAPVRPVIQKGHVVEKYSALRSVTKLKPDFGTRCNALSFGLP
jgi:hypothetical protein